METKGTKFRFGWVMVLLVAVSLLLMVGSFGVGYYHIAPWEILPALLGGDSPQLTVLKNLRMPRILAAFAIGGALAVGGSAYQGMFKNPLVSPDILGVSAGAGLGAALAIMGGLPAWGVQLSAFAFGIGTVAVCYLVVHRVPWNQTVSLILAGTMLQTLANAGVTMLKYLADPDDTLPAITFWLMGSLAKVEMETLGVAIPPMAVGFLILMGMRYRLNVLTLGDDEARSLGIDPRRTRAVAIAGATLLSASAVCIGGLIGFVGLMVPHVTRWLVGPQYGRLLPASCLIGGCFLLFMDDVARSLLTMEIPLGVMTAAVGAPFFLWLITRQGGGNP